MALHFAGSMLMLVAEMINPKNFNEVIHRGCVIVANVVQTVMKKSLGLGNFLVF